MSRKLLKLITSNPALTWTNRRYWKRLRLPKRTSRRNGPIFSCEFFGCSAKI